MDREMGFRPWVSARAGRGVFVSKHYVLVIYVDRKCMLGRRQQSTEVVPAGYGIRAGGAVWAVPTAVSNAWVLPKGGMVHGLCQTKWGDPMTADREL